MVSSSSFSQSNDVSLTDGPVFQQTPWTEMNHTVSSEITSRVQRSFHMVDLSKSKRVLIILPGIREKNVTDRLLSSIATKLNEMLGSEWVPQEVYRVPALTYSEMGNALSLTDITLRVSFERKPVKSKAKKYLPARG